MRPTSRNHCPTPVSSTSTSARCVIKSPLLCAPDNRIYFWVPREGFNLPIWGLSGRSIFTLLFQSYWATYPYRMTKSPTELRYRQLLPMIKIGLDVNMHAREFYSWDRPKSSMVTNILSEFIGHGLMNFDSTCHASLPLILIWHVMTSNRMRFYRRWRKVRMLIRLMHIVRASWQFYTSQVQYEKLPLKNFRMGELPHQPYYPSQARKGGCLGVNDRRDKDSPKKMI